ncbi:Target SNARE coiled-coil domain [Macleaya cordata]|uniref:Target SNARE coiled-coil domain n=1 Tax=Macleaya cordata TaxID=56857 RepID=A0A200Q7L8_MACCD|nr:Target SNARE coiled-coil domain [Macleaya cordata]
MAASVSSYRDRTSEFHSLSERLKKIEGVGAINDPGTSKASAEVLSQSEFKSKASKIGLGIHEASQKISRLAKLAKRSSMFDDPLVEIQELTALIKNDITMLNMAVSDLQTLQNLEISDGNCSKDRVVHATTICDDLKNRLMGTTKQFQEVLTTRTENLKAHENRKQIFSTNPSRENPFLNQAKPVTEPPPWSNNSDTSGILPPPAIPSSGVQSGNQLRRRLAVDSMATPQMEVSMLQQVVPRHDNYTQSRAVALQNVESTISELSGIFTQLATMVAHQGELAIRIDDNMDESLANVEGARSALLKHLNKISSNSR